MDKLKKQRRLWGFFPLLFFLLEPFKIYEGSKIEKIRGGYN